MISYDFVTIIQEQENIDILKAAIELGSRDTMQKISFPAIPIDDFIDTLMECNLAIEKI